MIRICLLAVAMSLCSLSGLAMAQNDQGPRHAHKAHVKKIADPNDVSEDWSIAAPSGNAKSSDTNQDMNASAGRKKFFEQSTTMENGGPAGHSGASGFTPSVGLNF